MHRATDIIKSIAARTDRAILFHSASGKDSIALLDLLTPHFREVVCVYMFVVKDLAHINRYIRYATTRYPNARFVQIPHFATYSYTKMGYMGCKQDPKQRKWTMAQLTDVVREQTGIEWAFFGFKQSDSMNRRVMLRTYPDGATNEKSKKCYPLSPYKNRDILTYIESRGLITPERYGQAQSQGCNITDLDYLLYLRENFPTDLRKVLAEYPNVERILFEHDYGKATPTE